MHAKNFHKKSKVELIPAFVWDCPECGVEQFERTIRAELSPEDMDYLRLQHGVDPLEEGDFLTQPREVQCSACKARFETVVLGVQDSAENELS
jgi:hypothetical protein